MPSGLGAYNPVSFDLGMYHRPLGRDLHELHLPVVVEMEFSMEPWRASSQSSPIDQAAG